jgi:hypothetical protein
MARKRNARLSGATVELFPFLAVLACVIGALTLIIIVVTTSALGGRRAITLTARDTHGRIVAKIPRYVEVRGDGVLLHPSGTLVTADELETARSPLRLLLAEVAKRRDREYVIVALRPDGYKLFTKVREMIEGRGLDIGYEPIDAGWRLRIREAR